MYTVWCTPQGDTELMSQEEVLDFKSVRRLEQVGDKRLQSESGPRASRWIMR
jgi:hypothetical protein